MRAGADDHIKAFLLGHLQPGFELAEIELAEVAHIGGHRALVVIPRNVGFDGVQAGLTHFLKAIAPEGLRTAEVMKGAAEEKDILAVNRDALAVELEAGGGLVLDRRRAGTGKRADAEQGAQEYREESEEGAGHRVKYFLAGMQGELTNGPS